MQEEVENRSVTLAISATKRSARVLKSAIAKLLERVDALEKRVKDMESQLQGAQTAEETEEITEG